MGIEEALFVDVVGGIGADAIAAETLATTGGAAWTAADAAMAGATAGGMEAGLPVFEGGLPFLEGAAEVGTGLSSAELGAQIAAENAGGASAVGYGSELAGSWNAGLSAADTGMASGGLSWGDIKSALPYVNAGMNVGSGLFGMNQSAQLRKLAAQQAAQGTKTAAPWAASGGQALADQQLQSLMRDPTSAANADPAYALRIQGAQRANAMYGQNSGQMAVAGANASTDWLNQRMATLGGLAGAPAQNAAAASAGNVIPGEMAANDLASKSLASISYGVNRVGGNAQNMPPEVARWLQQQGMA